MRPELVARLLVLAAAERPLVRLGECHESRVVEELGEVVEIPVNDLVLELREEELPQRVFVAYEQPNTGPSRATQSTHPNTRRR